MPPFSGIRRTAPVLLKGKLGWGRWRECTFSQPGHESDGWNFVAGPLSQLPGEAERAAALIHRGPQGLFSNVQEFRRRINRDAEWMRGDQRIQRLKVHENTPFCV